MSDDLVDGIRRDCRIAGGAFSLLALACLIVVGISWREMAVGNPSGPSGMVGAGFGAVIFLAAAIFFLHLGRSLKRD